MKYRPEIDGLRSVAVIPVVLFHMGIQGVDGGYIGVDIFFVISGFLITSIILQEFDEGQFTFRRFWTRRARRILPALLVMLASTSVVIYFVSFKGLWRRFGVEGAAAALSCANIAIYRLSGSYWDPNANESPFLHTWSLSVEEQFYLLYPFLLLLLLRQARQYVVLALSLLAALSFVVYICGDIYKPEATFYLLPTRIWELAVGCILAVWKSNSSHHTVSFRTGRMLTLSGLVVIITSYIYFTAANRFPGHLAIPVFSAALILAFGDQASIASKMLSHRGVVFIGKISYSLYLWHWPVIVFRQQMQAVGFAIDLLSLGIAIASLSLFSYFLVEKPTRHASFASPQLRCCMALFVVALSLSFYLFAHSPDYDTSAYAPLRWEGNTYSCTIADGWPSGSKVTEGIVATPRDPGASTSYEKGGIIRLYGGSIPEIVLIGDSHALMWAGTVDRIAASLCKTLCVYAAYGTAPFMEIPVKHALSNNAFFTAEQKYRYDIKRLEYLEAWKPKIVIIAARWTPTDNKKARDLIEFLGDCGSRIIFIEQPPELPFGNHNLLQYAPYLGLHPEGGQRKYLEASNDSRIRAGNDSIRSLCAEHSYCHFIGIGDLLRRNNHEALVLDGANLVYTDDDHLSQYGAELCRNRIEDAIRSLLGE